MKTWRHIYGMLLLTLALSACVKETRFSPSRSSGTVSFLPATFSGRTKAVATGNVFPVDSVFGTYAVYSADSTSFGVYMDNQRIAHNGSEWVPDLDYYWPRRNKVTFVSYAPYSATSPWLDEASYNTATAEGKSPDADDDWLISDIAADYNANTDEATDSAVPESGYSGVPTLFRHALARVAFNIKAGRVDDGSGTGTFVSIEDPRDGDSVEGDWEDVDETVITEDNGVQVLRTTITVRRRIVTTPVTQTSIVTTISAAQSWTIKVHNVAFIDAIATGTLELEAADDSHQFGTAERREWSGGWRLADGASYVTVPLPNAVGDNALTDSYQPLVAERTVIPQPLNHIKLLVDYSSRINATDVTVTTTKDSLTRTRTYTETHVVRTDILNGKLLNDDTDVTWEDSYSTPIQTVSVVHPEDHNTTVYLSKEIGLEGQGGLTEWGMGQRITYNITIEPSGKRITWDPAQVVNWGAFDNGSITIE